MLADANAPMGLGKIAALAGMSASKSRRYLVSFCRVGLVEQDSETGLYDLGWFALRLGLRAQARLSLVKQSRPILQEVRRLLDASVALVTWTQSGPTVVSFEENGRGILTLVAQLGATLPILSTAAGRICGAFLPREVLTETLEREIQHPVRSSDKDPAEGRIITMDEAWQLLEEVREQGLARTEGEGALGLATMAAPILGANQHLVGVLVALAFERNLDLAWDGQIATTLRQYASDIARRVGHNPGND